MQKTSPAVAMLAPTSAAAASRPARVAGSGKRPPLRVRVRAGSPVQPSGRIGVPEPVAAPSSVQAAARAAGSTA
jgi:hypothetical protein